MPELSPQQKYAYIANYATTGRLADSAKAVGSTFQNVALNRKNDPEFRAAVDEAYALYKDGLEAEVHRRGKEGWLDPVYNKGVKVGERRFFSDRMLELLVKRHIPEFRESYNVALDVSGRVLVVPGTAVDAVTWESTYRGSTPTLLDGNGGDGR